MQGHRKKFSGVTVLDHVQLNIRRGEIHALMGENGAGKSTIIKIITGVHSMDSGEIVFATRKDWASALFFRN